MPESATLSDVATSDIAPSSVSAHSLFSPSCAADANSDEPKMRTPRSRPTHHPFVRLFLLGCCFAAFGVGSVDSCVVVVLTFRWSWLCNVWWGRTRSNDLSIHLLLLLNEPLLWLLLWWWRHHLTLLLRWIHLLRDWSWKISEKTSICDVRTVSEEPKISESRVQYQKSSKFKNLEFSRPMIRKIKISSTSVSRWRGEFDQKALESESSSFSNL